MSKTYRFTILLKKGIGMKKILLRFFYFSLLALIPACRSRKKEPRKNTLRQMNSNAIKLKKQIKY